SMRRNSVVIVLDSPIGLDLGLPGPAASFLFVFIMENDGRRDFDFWFGDWTIHNRRLRRRLQNDTEWHEFPATGRCWSIMGGAGNVDTFDAPIFPTDGKPLHGTSFRTFNPKSGLWSIYWADDRSFDLQPPVHGRFENGRGEFLGDDTFDGRP